MGYPNFAVVRSLLVLGVVIMSTLDGHNVSYEKENFRLNVGMIFFTLMNFIIIYVDSKSVIIAKRNSSFCMNGTYWVISIYLTLFLLK